MKTRKGALDDSKTRGPVVNGTTVTFPFEFAKENGKWKILEF
jgi:hypothetical protein